jgi:hypothetical protein
MSDKRKDIRICNQHSVDRITEPVYCETTNNVHHLVQVIMDVPSNTASLSFLNATTNKSKGVGKYQALVCSITDIKKSNQFSWWQTLTCNHEDYEGNNLHPAAVNADELEAVIDNNNRIKNKEKMYKIINLTKQQQLKMDNRPTVVQIDKTSHKTTKLNT